MFPKKAKTDRARDSPTQVNAKLTLQAIHQIKQKICCKGLTQREKGVHVNMPITLVINQNGIGR